MVGQLLKHCVQFWSLYLKNNLICGVRKYFLKVATKKIDILERLSFEKRLQQMGFFTLRWSKGKRGMWQKYTVYNPMWHKSGVFKRLGCRIFFSLYTHTDTNNLKLKHTYTQRESLQPLTESHGQYDYLLVPLIAYWTHHQVLVNSLFLQNMVWKTLAYN